MNYPIQSISNYWVTSKEIKITWVILKYVTTHNYPQLSTTSHNHPQPSATIHNQPQPPLTHCNRARQGQRKKERERERNRLERKIRERQRERETERQKETERETKDSSKYFWSKSLVVWGKLARYAELACVIEFQNFRSHRFFFILVIWKFCFSSLRMRNHGKAGRGIVL